MRIVAVRHGETEWSKIGQHTGRTDLPLTDYGETEASKTASVLATWDFHQAFTSPLQRAATTASLAGFPGATVDDDLMEWAYGEHEGRRTVDIVVESPGFSKWLQRPPGGESVEEVGVRADRFLAKLRTAAAETDATDTVVFAHGHFLAILIARWLELPASNGRLFPLKTATLSVLETYQDRPVLRALNSECPGSTKALSPQPTPLTPLTK